MSTRNAGKTIFLLFLALGACATEVVTTEDGVTAVPETGARDQKNTGNCWLYATAGWAESLEYAKLIAEGKARLDDPSTRPYHLSIAYWNYWDWYGKLVGGTVKGTKVSALKEQLDSGGSWGVAVEIAERYGIARARSVIGDDVHNEADHTSAALKVMAESLANGPLKSSAARRDRTVVRKELDRAFAFQPGVREAMTAAFGDGSRTFVDGTATGNAIITAPADHSINVPRPDGHAKTVSLRDAIGRCMEGDNPDRRTGAYAWSVLPFLPSTADATREYFRRIQRALHQNVPLPISWYVASNGDEGHDGEYISISAKPAVAADSGSHETLVDDYEVEDVPGFGLLRAGTLASEAAKSAALADRSRIRFLRVKNSWGRNENAYGPAGYNDLYVDYLTGTVRACPKGARSNDSRCEHHVPLEDVILPSGF
jgi:hypothetical protein